MTNNVRVTKLPNSQGHDLKHTSSNISILGIKFLITQHITIIIWKTINSYPLTMYVHLQLMPSLQQEGMTGNKYSKESPLPSIR